MFEEQPLRAKMSVTIDINLIHWVEEQIKKQRFRNKSHAVEYALIKLKEIIKEESVGKA
jgi:Arc/MetJ-type ribon-helix-helix transcriptional regulator